MPRKSHRTRKNKSRRTRKTRHTKKHRGHKRSGHSRSGHKRHHIHSEYMMHGGNAPAFLVGSPYNAGDLNPKGNYLPLSNNGVPSGLPNPPMPSNPQFGGKRGKKGGCMDWFKKKSKRKGHKGRKGMRQRGGGLSDFMTAIVPDDLMNIGRSIPAAAGNFMDKFNGLSPLGTSQVYPTQQPLIQQGQNSTATVRPPDITGAYSRAVGSVQNI